MSTLIQQKKPSFQKKEEKRSCARLGRQLPIKPANSMFLELPGPCMLRSQKVFKKRKRKFKKEKKHTVEIAQLWQHSRGNFTPPPIYQEKWHCKCPYTHSSSSPLPVLFPSVSTLCLFPFFKDVCVCERHIHLRCSFVFVFSSFARYPPSL